MVARCKPGAYCKLDRRPIRIPHPGTRNTLGFDTTSPLGGTMLRSTLAAPGLSRAEVPACLYYVWLPGVSQEHIEQPFCITVTSEHDRVPRPEARSQLLCSYRVERCLPFSVKLAELYVWLPGVSQEHTANSTGRSAFLIPAPAARSGLTPPRLWVESCSKVGHVLVLQVGCAQLCVQPYVLVFFPLFLHACIASLCGRDQRVVLLCFCSL